MSDISLVRTVPEIRSRFSRFVPTTLMMMVMATGCGVYGSVMAVGELPPPTKVMTWTSFRAFLPPAPPPVRVVHETPKVAPNPNLPPREVPDGFRPEAPPTLIEKEFENPGPGFVPGDDNFHPADVPPPPPPPAPEPTKQVVVGGAIKPPMKTHHVAPVYPAIAQSARVQGVVIIQATIGVDGSVMEARILRSIPLLDEAALTAVRQWEFSPTLLNGKAVEVIMTVTVQFNLN